MTQDIAITIIQNQVLASVVPNAVTVEVSQNLTESLLSNLFLHLSTFTQAEDIVVGAGAGTVKTIHKGSIGDTLGIKPDGTLGYIDNQSSFDFFFSEKTTDDLAEGDNLYYTDARARASLSSSATGLSYDNATGVFSLSTGYTIPTNLKIEDWDDAFGWGNHAGLYDTIGTASSVMSGHTSAFDHTLIATALQSETDPVFSAWLIATPPLYSYTETDPVWSNEKSSYALLSDVWKLNGNTLGVKKTIGSVDAFAFGIITNNLERITILADGKVGIGTESPAQKFHVSGGGIQLDNNFAIYSKSAGGTAFKMIEYTSADNLVIKGGASGTDLYLHGSSDAGTKYVVIKNTGDVGINIVTPIYKLDVNGTLGVRGQITQRTTAGYLKSLNVAGDNHVIQYFQASNYSWDIGTTPKMVMDTAGRLGIGCSPATSAKVDIKGSNSGTTLNLNDDTTLGRLMITGAGTGYTQADTLLQTSATVRGTGHYTYDSQGQVTWFTGNPYSTGSGAWVLNVKPSSATFQVDTAQSNAAGVKNVITALSNGNVGIGTTSPTAKLDVNSDILRLRTAKTPATAGATGNAGDICWDADYMYVCVATNTWKRSALTTWP